MKLYVGNLSYQTDADGLRRLFSQCGNVLDAVIVMDRETGRPRGFGFVQMDDADAQRAIQSLNGANLDGRSIAVNEAKGGPAGDRRGPPRPGPGGDRPPRRDGPGGYGGGGYREGGGGDGYREGGGGGNRDGGPPGGGGGYRGGGGGGYRDGGGGSGYRDGGGGGGFRGGPGGYREGGAGGAPGGYRDAPRGPRPDGPPRPGGPGGPPREGGFRGGDGPRGDGPRGDDRRGPPPRRGPLQPEVVSRGGPAGPGGGFDERRPPRPPGDRPVRPDGPGGGFGGGPPRPPRIGGPGFGAPQEGIEGWSDDRKRRERKVTPKRKGPERSWEEGSPEALDARETARRGGARNRRRGWDDVEEDEDGVPIEAPAGGGEEQE